LRTNRPDARAAIADAAFVRSCGNFYSAMQPASWKRPFKATISVGFKPIFRRVMFEFTDRGTKPTFIKNGWTSAFADSRFELGMMLLVGHVSKSLYSSTAFDPRVASLARSSGMRDAVTSIQIS
jgi:hypothetical protein